MRESDKLAPLIRSLGIPRLLIPLLERMGARQEIDGEKFRVLTKLKTDEFELREGECQVPSITRGGT